FAEQPATAAHQQHRYGRERQQNGGRFRNGRLPGRSLLLLLLLLLLLSLLLLQTYVLRNVDGHGRLLLPGRLLLLLLLLLLLSLVIAAIGGSANASGARN